MDTLHIDIDISRWTSIANALNETAMENAWRRTLRKTSNWVKAKIAREVSIASQIPAKEIRKRLYFFLRSKVTGKVWLGLNAIEADRLGAAKQTSSGVKVGRHSFPGAWIYRSRYSDGGKESSVKIRRSDGTIETKRYASSDKNTGKVYQRVGRARLPYRRVRFDWSESGESAFHRAAANVEARLMEILRQEVHYELQKAAGHA